MAEKHEHSKLEVLTKPYIFKTARTLLVIQVYKVIPEKGTSILVLEGFAIFALCYGFGDSQSGGRSEAKLAALI